MARRLREGQDCTKSHGRGIGQTGRTVVAAVDPAVHSFALSAREVQLRIGTSSPDHSFELVLGAPTALDWRSDVGRSATTARRTGKPVTFGHDARASHDQGGCKRRSAARGKWVLLSSHLSGSCHSSHTSRTTLLGIDPERSNLSVLSEILYEDVTF